MPEVESLMQVHAAPFEEYLEKTGAPRLSHLLEDSGTFSLKDLVRVVCVLSDIPVHDGHLADSLHVLFTLYSEFRANQHFAGFSGGLPHMPSGLSPEREAPFSGRAGTPV